LILIFIKTEYSFKEVFVKLEAAIDKAIEIGHKEVCIVDTTTFGFVKFEKYCKEKGVKAIYGLEVFVTDEKIQSRSKYDTYNIGERILVIAKSQKGIQDLYKLYTKSTEQMYYFNRIFPCDLINIDCIIISDKFDCDYKYSDVCTHTAKYIEREHLSTYQCITGSHGPHFKKDLMLTDTDLIDLGYKLKQIALKNRIGISIDAIDLPKSGMIKYYKKKSFELECWAGLEKLGLDDKPEYVSRLEFEIDMIKSKDFQDYFLIVSDMIQDAKKKMIVGPGRGSSGGSLVCYAMGITNLDPILHGLIFERFIDTNRYDFPDIDTDYPDKERQSVIADTAKKYSSAYQLGIVSTYKPKVVIGDFAKEYKIPAYELDELKNTIIERSSGDARSQACLADTYEGTVIGKDFVNRYPEMLSTKYAEGHARHSGRHAAGIIVTTEPITNYASVDTIGGNIQLEGPQAEGIGLLKIDCLGLRTLSVIQDCLRLSGVDYEDIYDIDIENTDVLNVFNGARLSDVFQFDGDAISMVNKRINVKSFSDLAAITALGRPGALNSGGTNHYINVDDGSEEPVYHGEIYEKITKETNGIVVYQEQTMQLLREFGNLSWGDVNVMRKIISKSRGDEFFATYKKKFIDGAAVNGYTEEQAETVWSAIASMGSYAFNKSHAVAYAMISYWCAYCKHYYPLNFLAANLNNAKDDEHALKMLRQYVKEYGIEYIPVDPDISDIDWTIYDGKLIGGLTNIVGIGEKKAKEIIGRREAGGVFTKAMMEKLLNPKTPFDRLNPLFEDYNFYYNNYNITQIDKLEEGKCITLGKVINKDLRDRNDLQSVMKRKGELVNDNQYYLNLVVSDDTGDIKCTIAPFDMGRLDGMGLSESLAIGDIVVVKGTIRSGWQTIGVREITRL
jgi:DNA polymerase III alpha subunit